jgi:ElaB/YqjD/DUF883 family membrane-anchored ribosome-binding protein
MHNIPFHHTAMGRDFFDRNIPMLVRQLTRLNDNLEKLIKQKADTLDEKEEVHLRDTIEVGELRTTIPRI